ncbi:uncharacterized protein [Triticum aestivum]|uniref:uncharacterized protein n=1 Tax=Triticum aestivum TaxID=4565 RepID=UPI001D01C82E|nr:uncharacterized protein LOC123182807 [Triticum aestivum]
MAAAAALRSTIGLAVLRRAASPGLSSSAGGGSSGLAINPRRRTMATGGQGGAVWKTCKDAAFATVAGGVAGGVAGVGMILFASRLVGEHDDYAEQERRTRKDST